MMNHAVLRDNEQEGAERTKCTSSGQRQLVGACIFPRVDGVDYVFCCVTVDSAL